jgi:hypothetical protein
MFPQLVTFDRGDAMTACTRRERSNTPLQALTLLNGPTFVEAARQIGRQLAVQSELSDERRVAIAYQRILSREPDEFELDRVTQLLARMRSTYLQNAEAARQLVGEDAAATVTMEEQAAWIAFARTLLNLDEVITRE